MDHLKTSEERRARWYSSVRRRYIPVVPAKAWQDLVQSRSLDCYESIYSLPFDWLLRQNQGIMPDDDDDMLHDTIHSSLQEHGILVVSGVLSPKDCHDAMELGWDWIEAASLAEQQLLLHQETKGSCVASETSDIGSSSVSVTSDAVMSNTVKQQLPPVRRTDKSTWSSECFPCALEGGILPFYGSGHSSCAWMVRSHPHVQRVFSALHGCGADRLIASLDGLIFWRPHDKTDSGWFHVDQNPRKKPNQECVQGLVNLLPVTPSTGGNVVAIQSHKHFARGHYLDRHGHACGEFYHARLDEVTGDDWLEVDPNDSVILDPKGIISVLLQPGDMLLWDSRVAHCSYGCDTTMDGNDLSPSPAKANNNTPTDGYGLSRAAVLVSMMPASRASPHVLEERKQAVSSSRTLTHWADQVAPLGAECTKQVELERQRVEWIREWQQQQQRGETTTTTTANKNIIYAWEDLSDEQKKLVTGCYDP